MIQKIGLIGLGKMGFNLIQNLKRNGYQPVGFDLHQERYGQLANLEIETSTTIEELIQKLPQPRYVMLMVPAGAITQQTIAYLVENLTLNDVIIDAGNSFYEDSIKNAKLTAEKGLHFVDAGTSGGTGGALNGACFMVGGPDIVMQELGPMFEKIAVQDGYLHTGPAGSGHFAKMVHNGIEYGMMQAIGEGFEIINNSPFAYNKQALAKVWNHGSVIRSWLMELSENAFAKDNNLEHIKGVIQMNGEGLWTVQEALKQGTPVPVISLSVQVRQQSVILDSYSGKVVAALRDEFGGHGVVKQ
jgi:6-phosphogluconate dehydrogenase